MPYKSEAQKCAYLRGFFEGIIIGLMGGIAMAPYRSDAQRKKFHAMLKRGEISKETVDEWDKASKGKKLPERVKPKKGKRNAKKERKKTQVKHK